MSIFKLKVILVERVFVKNRILQPIVKNQFAEHYILTVGVDILTKDVEFRPGEVATLSIWDLRLQKRFEHYRSTFYKGAAGVILIFDLTKEKTYTDVRNYLTEIKQFAGEKIPFILIGIKVDLVEDVVVGIDREEATKFAKNEGGFYIETSPTGIDIIDDAICWLTRRIFDLRS